MSEASSPKVSKRTRYLQRFGATALGAYAGGFLGLLILHGGGVSAIQEYTIALFAYDDSLYWFPVILAVAIGMFAKRPKIGFVLALLISGIGTSLNFLVLG